jgi:putative holliday junction resolvase
MKIIFPTFVKKNNLARVIGIDYGKKRVGIAVTDPQKIIASSLTTVLSHEVLQFLDDYLSKEKVECMVLGWPVNLNNKDSESMIYVKQFLVSLKRRFPDMRIETIDERFSSKMASRSMIESGMRKSERRKKENVDMISAAIILQSFLDKENYKKQES